MENMNKTTRSDAHNVDPRSIILGVNPRKVYDDPTNTIAMLKDFIREHGVKILPPIKVKKVMIDGEERYKLMHGYRRVTAFRELISEGVEIARVKAELVDKNYSESDELIDHVCQNSGKSLLPFEEALIYRQLENLNWTQGEIAKKVGKTNAHISNMLKISGAPRSVQDAMAQGIITATMVLIIMQKHGDNAEQVILDAIQVAKDSGKAKVTAKTVEATVEAKEIAPRQSRYQKAITLAIAKVAEQNNNEKLAMLRKAEQIIAIMDTYKDDELISKLAEVM
jgi:ParB/RepB/Spo0J family partition protein